jgi:hypothetical protein
MPVFIELVTDAFQERFTEEVAERKHTTGRAGASDVRRPTRGLEIKEDTYAIIKVIRSDGTSIPLTDSNVGEEGTVTGYSNFILQSVQEQRMEKHQIVETFGETYIYFFGEAPRFLDVSAFLLNSHDFNWEAEWWDNYDKYLRGTKCVEMGARAYLFYDDNIVEGYILMAQAAKVAQEPLSVKLQFKFFVTNYRNISLVGDAFFPIRASVQLPDDVVLTRGDAAADLILTHLRGESYDEKVGTSLNEYGVGAIGPTPFGGYKKISDAFRAASRSYAYSPDVFRLMATLDYRDRMDMEKIVRRRGNPLRGKISENVDEFTGSGMTHPDFKFGGAGLQAPDAISPTVRDIWEVNDLFRQAIEMLSCFGANVNSPDGLGGIGLGVSFGAGGGASFGAGASAGFGFGTTAGAESGVGAYSSFGSDPLGNIYGPSGADTENDPRYSQGHGDPTYGYASAYAGAGFGQAGFGDFGGAGFGSGQGSTGDPGFKDPSKFTFAGVSDNRSAWDRFNTPVEDQTAIGGFGVGVSAGVGLGAGAGLGANSHTSVGGQPSAFAIASVEGTLDLTGGARSSAQAISDRLAQQRFGFSVDNPYGVSCADTDEGGNIVSESWSWP